MTLVRELMYYNPSAIEASDARVATDLLDGRFACFKNLRSCENKLRITKAFA
jgi:hypothetical protein